MTINHFFVPDHFEEEMYEINVYHKHHNDMILLILIRHTSKCI
jgi:hypothetical protein